MMTRLTRALTASVALVGVAFAQQKAPWIGRRVFTPYGTVLKVGGAVVDDEGRGADFRASGHQRSLSRVYRVAHVRGGPATPRGLVLDPGLPIAADRGLDDETPATWTPPGRARPSHDDSRGKAIRLAARGRYLVASGPAVG